MNEGTLDIGIVCTLPDRNDIFEVLPFVEDPLEVIVHPEHRLAGAASVDFADLREEGFVLYKGSLHQGLPRDLTAIRGTLSSCGCGDLAEFYRDVRVEKQSTEAYREGGTSIFRF